MITAQEIKELIDRVKDNPYVEGLNIKFNIIDKGVVEARMPIAKEHLQYRGVVHGGVIASLADTMTGFAAHTMIPADKDILTVELKISYLRAVQGNELFSKGYVVKAGRNIYFCECEIYCEDKLVTKASATLCVVPKKA